MKIRTITASLILIPLLGCTGALIPLPENHSSFSYKDGDGDIHQYYCKNGATAQETADRSREAHLAHQASLKQQTALTLEMLKNDAPALEIARFMQVQSEKSVEALDATFACFPVKFTEG